MTASPKKVHDHFPQLVAGLMVWAIVAGLVWFTQGLPFKEEGAPGPRFMPILLAVVLGILNVFYWMGTFFFHPEKRLVLPRFSQLIRPFGFFLVGFVMIFLWERLGVVVTVLIASFFELKVIEGYSWSRAVLVGLILSLSTWLLFQVVLGIPLPTGPFEWLAFI